MDDGSDIPAEQELAGFEFGPDKIIRQENRGLLLARLRGLEKASGNYTLFLDADDLIGPRKLSDTVAAFTDQEMAVVYSDTARTCLEGAYADLKIEPDAPAPNANNLAELCIEVQPAPHSPIFRTEFLRELVARPLFPPLRLTIRWRKFGFTSTLRSDRKKLSVSPALRPSVARMAASASRDAGKKWRWHRCWSRRRFNALVRSTTKRRKRGGFSEKRFFAAGALCLTISPKNTKAASCACGDHRRIQG